MTPARVRPSSKHAAATWREVLLSEVLPGVDPDGGKRMSGGEGKIYFNARYYDPTTGRFLTEDPSRKGVNWYAYCENNPVNMTDPSGREGVREGIEEPFVSLKDVNWWNPQPRDPSGRFMQRPLADLKPADAPELDEGHWVILPVQAVKDLTTKQTIEALPKPAPKPGFYNADPTKGQLGTAGAGALNDPKTQLRTNVGLGAAGAGFLNNPAPVPLFPENAPYSGSPPMTLNR
jgi:RHS repeat-associated protein